MRARARKSFSGGMARVVWDEGVAGLKGVIGRSRVVYHSEQLNYLRFRGFGTRGGLPVGRGGMVRVGDTVTVTVTTGGTILVGGGGVPAGAGDSGSVASLSGWLTEEGTKVLVFCLVSSIRSSSVPVITA